MKYIYSIFLLFLFSACSHRHPLSDFNFQTVTAPPYVLASWYKITQVNAPVKFYIEGDASSYDAQGNPSNNPTPKNPFMRELAAQDPAPNVVYLGLPCQYFQTSLCSPEAWSCNRFSSQNIHSMEQTVRSFMKKARSQQMILIGYSGGAQMAGAIALQHKDQVKQLITIAGILDPQSWNAYHHRSEKSDSTPLIMHRDQFLKLPQKHYVGDRDQQVPPHLVQEYVQNQAPVIVIHKATHDKGFDEISEDLYDL